MTVTSEDENDLASHLEGIFQVNDAALQQMSSQLAELQEEFARTHPENATPAQYGILLKILATTINVLETSRKSQEQAHQTVCALLRDAQNRNAE